MTIEIQILFGGIIGGLLLIFLFNLYGKKITWGEIMAIIATIVVAAFIIYAINLNLSKSSNSSNPPLNLTKQISINAGGGILTVNATFSDIMNGTTNWYSSYKINNATEELPNGTIFIPATSYVQKQIQADCITDYKGMYLPLGNYDYYWCS